MPFKQQVWNAKCWFAWWLLIFDVMCLRGLHSRGPVSLPCGSETPKLTSCYLQHWLCGFIAPLRSKHHAKHRKCHGGTQGGERRGGKELRAAGQCRTLCSPLADQFQGVQWSWGMIRQGSFVMLMFLSQISFDDWALYSEVSYYLLCVCACVCNCSPAGIVSLPLFKNSVCICEWFSMCLFAYCSDC